MAIYECSLPWCFLYHVLEILWLEKCAVLLNWLKISWEDRVCYLWRWMNDWSSWTSYFLIFNAPSPAPALLIKLEGAGKSLFRWFSKMSLKRIFYIHSMYPEWGKTWPCVGLNSKKGGKRYPWVGFIEP